MLFCRHYFSPLNTFMRKGKDPEPEPDPHLLRMDPGPDPGGAKPWGSGSPTLVVGLELRSIDGSYKKQYGSVRFDGFWYRTVFEWLENGTVGFGN
jgi:hypothetical protein